MATLIFKDRKTWEIVTYGATPKKHKPSCAQQIRINAKNKRRRMEKR